LIGIEKEWQTIARHFFVQMKWEPAKQYKVLVYSHKSPNRSLTVSNQGFWWSVPLA
jgi:hypothetical protein